MPNMRRWQTRRAAGAPSPRHGARDRLAAAGPSGVPDATNPGPAVCGRLVVTLFSGQGARAASRLRRYVLRIARLVERPICGLLHERSGRGTACAGPQTRQRRTSALCGGTSNGVSTALTCQRRPAAPLVSSGFEIAGARHPSRGLPCATSCVENSPAPETLSRKRTKIPRWAAPTVV